MNGSEPVIQRLISRDATDLVELRVDVKQLTCSISRKDADRRQIGHHRQPIGELPGSEFALAQGHCPFLDSRLQLATQLAHRKVIGYAR